jgi:hypothetical protein
MNTQAALLIEGIIDLYPQIKATGGKELLVKLYQLGVIEGNIICLKEFQKEVTGDKCTLVSK